jgi:hypothetical protein
MEWPRRRYQLLTAVVVALPIILLARPPETSAAAAIDGRELSARKNSGVVFRGCEKRLKIAVPHKRGFKAFVNVTHPHTERQKVTGYSIDIFDSAMRMLQPPSQYEYHVFNGSYDELVQSVSLKVRLTSRLWLTVVFHHSLVRFYLSLLFTSCGVNRCLMQQLGM